MMTGEVSSTKTISTLEKMYKLRWNNVMMNGASRMCDDPAVGIDVIVISSRTTGTSAMAYTNIPSPDHLHPLKGTPVPPPAYLTVLEAQLSLGESFMPCKGIYPILVSKLHPVSMYVPIKFNDLL